jgi:hypothetical protein
VCTKDDLWKLTRLVRYLIYAKELGLLLRPGKHGIVVKASIEAA